MNISPASLSALALGQVQDDAAILMLKKSLSLQGQSALALINALPQTSAPPLATEGSLGTQVNTYA